MSAVQPEARRWLRVASVSPPVKRAGTSCEEVSETEHMPWLSAEVLQSPREGAPPENKGTTHEGEDVATPCVARGDSIEQSVLSAGQVRSACPRARGALPAQPSWVGC